MLNVVTIQWGNYHGRGEEYVHKFFAGVARNLKGVSYRPICFTDKPEWVPAGVEARDLPGNLIGYWNKVYLFKAGLFDDGDRVIYMDLSLVPVGRLHDFAAYDGGLAMCRDFMKRGEMLNSGMMLWPANSQNQIWYVWHQNDCPQFHPEGDQRWIEDASIAPGVIQNFFANQLYSYKVDCLKGLPASAKIVAFHGVPKPHVVAQQGVPWLIQNWRT